MAQSIKRLPDISVVMSAYNAQSFISESVKGIIDQTYKDFEFIVIDDGSTDDTWQTLLSFAHEDERIILERNSTNAGVVKSLNKGLDRSKGRIIVRQDADDISHPIRLEKQLAYLNTHPECGVVAAIPQLIDHRGLPLTDVRFTDTKNEEIQRKLMDYMCLCGPSIMVRREALKSAGFYFSPGLDASEDYDLCLRLAEVTQFGSLPGDLYQYRQHTASASNKRAHYQMHNKAVALERAVYRRFGPTPSVENFKIVGRDYLHAAIIGLSMHELAAARKSLVCALSVYPPLLNDDQPVEKIIRDYTPRDGPDQALDYLTAVFQELLPHTRRLERMESKLISDIHMGKVFEGVNNGQPRLINEHLWPGISHQPSWLLNRGVLSILIRRFIQLPSDRRYHG